MLFKSCNIPKICHINSCSIVTFPRSSTQSLHKLLVSTYLSHVVRLFARSGPSPSTNSPITLLLIHSSAKAAHFATKYRYYHRRLQVVTFHQPKPGHYHILRNQCILFLASAESARPPCKGPSTPSSNYSTAQSPTIQP